MIVAGIDPSLTNTAVCVYDTDLREVTHMKCFSSNAAPTMDGRISRYEYLSNGILGVLNECKPRLVCLEGYSYGSRGRATLDIAEYGGILRSDLLDWLASTGESAVEIPPATLKKFACGKGNANKVEMAGAITKRYGVCYNTSDEYDAYALAKLAACIMDAEEPQTAKQIEAVATARQLLEREQSER